VRMLVYSWSHLRQSFEFLQLIRRWRTSDFPAIRSKNSLALFRAKKITDVKARVHISAPLKGPSVGETCGLGEEKCRRDNRERPLCRNQNSA